MVTRSLTWYENFILNDEVFGLNYAKIAIAEALIRSVLFCVHFEEASSRLTAKPPYLLR